MTIAIIGAGLAGLCAARDLVRAGRHVVVFEKSGGLGGRVATRRSEAASFDHGAPLLHGVEIDAHALPGAVPWRDGWIGAPGNSALGRALGAGLDLRGRTPVTGLARLDGAWRLDTAEPHAGRFATVLIATPCPQARTILGPFAERFAGLDAVRMRPGWTLMAEFDACVPGPAWRDDLAAPIGQAHRNTTKPGRPATEAWVIHADEATAAHDIEATPEDMASRLMQAFRDQTGAPAPVRMTAHRWRHARVDAPLGAPCLYDADLRLGLAGDWCIGPLAGDAIASGRALAHSVLAKE